jgi:thiamine kinase-like enzyme
MTAMAPAPTREIEEALERHGFEARTLVLVSPLKERKGRRLAYRVEDRDGKRVKLRQFESGEEARRVFELRAGLEEAFAPALARYDSVLVEEWVDGAPLTELDAESRAQEAGALLGRLHTRRLAPDVPARIETRRWRDGAESDLEILGDAGKLTSEEADRLRTELQERDPGVERAAVVHLDFCAENMLIDPSGRLRVIDNEQLAVEPIGLDLGRTFQRWPMGDATRARFRSGYRSSAPSAPQATGFWRIVAALVGARVLLQRGPERIEPSLALLRRLAAGEGLSDPSWP